MSRHRVLSTAQKIELHLRGHQLQQFTVLVSYFIVLLKQLH